MISEENFVPYQTTNLTGKRTLVLAPHPDDETFGCGGALALHVRAGDPVKVVFLTNGAKGDTTQGMQKEVYVALRRKEAEEACGILGVDDLEFWEYEDRKLTGAQGVLKRAVDLLESYQPELVYTPSPLEFHPDHRAAAFLICDAVRSYSGEFDLVFYEVGQPLSVNCLVDIGAVLDVKRRAVASYKSQLEERPYDDILTALNRFRSLTLPEGVAYAEGFSRWRSDFVRKVAPHQIPFFDQARLSPLITEAGPLVSIIVRTKDRPGLLTNAIRSISSQTYPNIEIILVNDGGEDVKVLALSLAGEIPVTYVAHDHTRGRAAAANSGLKAAKGLYVNFLDDDDVLYPDHVEALVALLKSTGKKVGYSGARNVYFQGPPHLLESRVREEVIFNLEFNADLLLFENYIPSMCVLFCKDVLPAVGEFSEDLDLFEDWDFWIRLSRHFPFARTARITCEYRFYGVDSVEASHRGKYAYDRALAKLFDRNRDLMDGEAWLRFLERGLPARMRKENEACLAWSRELETRVKSLQEANDECSAWGHELRAELERVQKASDECSAWGHELRAELERVQKASDECSAWGHKLQAELERVQKANDECAAWGHGLHAELKAVYGSTSWRITRPLRGCKKVLLGMRRLPGKVLRTVYTNIPASDHGRYRTMSFVYRHFNIFFRRTPSYQRWAHVKDNHQELQPVAPLPVLEEHDQRCILEFPGTGSVEVSVILSLNALKETTLPCMVTLRQEMLPEPSELIIVDNLSPDDKPSFFERISGVKVVPSAYGSELASAWNHGARMASGKYLVFLHCETQVTPNWLRELVGSLRNSGDVGLVGSKVIRRDGRLGEAGGAMEDNTKLRHYGTDRDPRSPQYCYVREVDFCSGISLAIEKELFSKMGGFNEAIDGENPSYLGADLSLGVKGVGKKVLYQAMSEVVCHDHPWPLDKLPRPETLEALESKREKLIQARHESSSVRWLPEKCSEKRILMIDTWTPTPDKDSGSNDVVSFMKIFRYLSLGVTFIPAGDLAFFGGYTQDLQRMGVECLYAPFVKDVAVYLETHGRRFDVVLLYRCHCASAHFEMVRKHCPRAKIIFDTVDLHFLREQRQATVERSPVMAAQAQETKLKELSLIRKADRTIVLSAAERNVLVREHGIPENLVSVIPIVREIPGLRNPFKTRRNILFIGGYEHKPNVDAAVFFVSSVWPLVRKRLTDVRFFILGSKPPEEVVRLGEEPGVTVVGYVTDLSEYFDQCRLSVAPLRYGAGIKGKVGTSISYGVPCVASSVAVEGSGMTDGVEMLVADDPVAFSEAVVRLYVDEELWRTLSENGLSFARANYSLEAGRQKIAEMLRTLGVVDDKYFGAENVPPAVSCLSGAEEMDCN